MSAPLKAIVPVVLVSTTLVTVSTAPANVVPAEFVMVTEPILVPIARRMFTRPVELIIRLDGQLRLVPYGAAVAVPIREPIVIAPELPPPKVKVTPWPKVMLSKLIGLIPKSIVELTPIKRVVPPLKITPQSGPVQVVTVDFVKLPAMIFSPAWRIPRSKVNVSGVPDAVQTQSTIVVVRSPKYTDPVVLSVTKSTIRVVPP